MHSRKYLHLLLWFFMEEKSKLWKIFAKTWRYVLSILNTWSIMKTYGDLSHNQNIPLEWLDVVKTIWFFDKSVVASMNVCCMISHQNNINYAWFFATKGRHMVFVLNSWSKLRIYEDFQKILLLMEINSQTKAKTYHSSKIKVTLYNYWSLSSN